MEDRVRSGKDTGIGRLPSRHEQIRRGLAELALISADLLALTQSMLLIDEPELTWAEPKTLRYRLLHIAAPDHSPPAQGVPTPGRALRLPGAILLIPLAA